MRVNSYLWLCALLLLVADAAPGSSSYPLRSHPVLGEYSLPPSLEIELVAQEPMVFDPVDLEFDEFGAAWVLEMVGFPVVPDGEPGPDRVVRLRDTNNDGVFDDRQVFADGLRYADSLLPYRGGLLVADPPDLIYLRDQDGDGRADIRQTLLSGFAVGPSESNFNGLTFGPDGWVHGANGSSGGAIYFPDHPDDKTSIRGLDLRFRFELDQRSGRLHQGRFEATTAMGGGFGVTFDDWGRRWVTHEQKHIQAVMIESHYLTRDYSWPKMVLEVSDHGQGDTARIFPISVPAERPNHPEQAGYFTSGCGITHYGGGRLGAEFNGSFFVGEAVHNLVHRDLVAPTAVTTPLAKRAAAESRSEFLAATDPWFRPVNFTTGPDGLLYLVDMQRGVVEHPEWIPQELEDGFDLRAGAERGRIYRIRRKDEDPGSAHPGVLAEADTQQLIAELGNTNQWRRFTAHRLLQERAPTGVAALLEKGLLQAPPLARAHRLWLLSDLGAARLELLTPHFSQDHPRLRQIALDVLSRTEVVQEDRPAALALVRQQIDASDPGVRTQALLTLSRIIDLWQIRSIPESVLEGMTESATLSHDDVVLQTAILLLARHQPNAALDSLTEQLEDDLVPLELVSETVRLAARKISLPALTQTLNSISELRRDDHRIALLDALAEALPQSPEKDQHAATGEQLEALLEPSLQPTRSDREVLAAWKILDRLGLEQTSSAASGQLSQRAKRARSTATSGDPTLEERLQALTLFEILPQDQQVESLLALLVPGTPSQLKLAALDRLAQMPDPRIGEQIVSRWRSFTPEVRTRAGDILLYRRSNHETLLDALENGRILVGEMNFHLERRRTLLRWSTDEVGERAQKLFSDGGVDTRRQAYDAAEPALFLAGNDLSGQEIFQELCARCHQIQDRGSLLGTDVGPDLSDIFRKSASSILHDLVDPNARAGSEYLAYDVETTEGELVSGVLVSDDEARVVLRQADGQTRSIPRQRVRTLESTGLSLMPEELEVGLTHQQIADLLAFLQRPR